MNYAKRLFRLLLSGTLVLSLAACSSGGNTDTGDNTAEDQKEEKKEDTKKTESERFDEFLEAEFVEAMESDYTTYHQFVENPDDFGIDVSKIEVNLGPRISQESINEDRKESIENGKQIDDFDREKLTDSQKLIYDTYKWQAEIDEQLADEKFDYYNNFFESMGGVHYNLPVMFADWVLRNEQDVKDMITCLKDVQPYVQDVLTYTKEQEKRGLMSIDFESVIDYCQGIVDKGEKSAVLTAMIDTMKELKLENEADYEKQITEAFTESFIPAYQDIIDTMKELQAKGTNNENGLAQFEYGKEYYSLILHGKTGNNWTPEEVKAYCESQSQKYMDKTSEMMSEENMTKHPEIALELLAVVSGLPITTDFKSYEEILEFSKTKMYDHVPQIGDIEYDIFDVNEEIASDSGIAAYFEIPALDATTPKQMRVNPKGADTTSLETYKTVCHEGLPGHMYQYAYMYENSDSNWLKAIAGNLGYTEGWAVYAEYMAYDYVETAMSKEIIDFMRYFDIQSYMAIIAADIGIHYEGWTIKEFTEYMNEKGFSMAEADALGQFKQLQANPAAFEPYYVGYLQILDLKEKTQKALGDSFNEIEFNRVILDCGNMPFPVVEAQVDAYIEANAPKEESKEEAKEDSKEEAKEETKDDTKEESKEETKEDSKTETKEDSKEETKEDTKKEDK